MAGEGEQQPDPNAQPTGGSGEGTPPAQQQGGKSEGGRLREQYEAEKAKNADLESRLARMERTQAFKDAGIPDSGPGVGLFREHYKGELDAAKIREAAEAEGVLQPKQTTPDSDRDAFARMHEEPSAPVARPGDPLVSSEHIEKINKMDDNDEIVGYLRNVGLMPRAES